MNDDRQRQRLAAILAADAVGYSRLMEADEQATMAALDAARTVFRAEVAAHHGASSTRRATRCSRCSTPRLAPSRRRLPFSARSRRRRATSPRPRRMQFRIGVHLGDVIERPDGDVHGDGVNIAARLQALAQPGGIVVSEAVRGAVKSRLAAKFDDLGMQAVKNIADPVRAFAVHVDESLASHAAAAPTSRRSSRLARIGAACAAVLIAVGVIWWQRTPPAPVTPGAAAIAVRAPATASLSVPAPTGKPSIAVLPFDNMSGEADKAYFADGITEDLITDLSKVGGLVVIARNSTFQYRGKARDVREIGKALNARYVLEGSVRRSGESVRVNAQLIDAASGAHVWADRYDGDLKNIFGVQDTITRNVVKALSVELTKDESARVANRGTANVKAYDVLLKGWEHYLRQTPEEFRAAIVDFKRSAELDPSYSRAYAALAAVYWDIYTHYWGPALGLTRSAYDAEQYLAKAMRDPTPLAHQVSSAMLIYAQQHDEGIAEARRAIANDPNDADGYIALAGALSGTSVCAIATSKTRAGGNHDSIGCSVFRTAIN